MEPISNYGQKDKLSEDPASSNKFEIKKMMISQSFEELPPFNREKSSTAISMQRIGSDSGIHLKNNSLASHSGLKYYYHKIFYPLKSIIQEINKKYPVHAELEHWDDILQTALFQSLANYPQWEKQDKKELQSTVCADVLKKITKSINLKPHESNSLFLQPIAQRLKYAIDLITLSQQDTSTDLLPFIRLLYVLTNQPLSFIKHVNDCKDVNKDTIIKLMGGEDVWKKIQRWEQQFSLKLDKYWNKDLSKLAEQAIQRVLIEVKEQVDRQWPVHQMEDLVMQEIYDLMMTDHQSLLSEEEIITIVMSCELSQTIKDKILNCLSISLRSEIVKKKLRQIISYKEKHEVLSTMHLTFKLNEDIRKDINLLFNKRGIEEKAQDRIIQNLKSCLYNEVRQNLFEALSKPEHRLRDVVINEIEKIIIDHTINTILKLNTIDEHSKKKIIHILKADRQYQVSTETVFNILKDKQVDQSFRINVCQILSAPWDGIDLDLLAYTLQAHLYDLISKQPYKLTNISLKRLQCVNEALQKIQDKYNSFSCKWLDTFIEQMSPLTKQYSCDGLYQLINCINDKWIKEYLQAVLGGEKGMEYLKDWDKKLKNTIYNCLQIERDRFRVLEAYEKAKNETDPLKFPSSTPEDFVRSIYYEENGGYIFEELTVSRLQNPQQHHLFDKTLNRLDFFKNFLTVLKKYGWQTLPSQDDELESLARRIIYKQDTCISPLLSLMTNTAIKNAFNREVSKSFIHKKLENPEVRLYNIYGFNEFKTRVARATEGGTLCHLRIGSHLYFQVIRIYKTITGLVNFGDLYPFEADRLEKAHLLTNQSSAVKDSSIATVTYQHTFICNMEEKNLKERIQIIKLDIPPEVPFRLREEIIKIYMSSCKRIYLSRLGVSTKI